MPDLVLIGCDFSTVAIRKLREAKIPGLEFARLFTHDIRKPMEGPIADAVVCTELLEHLEDPAAALANMAVLARRIMIISVPFRDRIAGPEHVWAFEEAEVRELLAPFGIPEITRARRGIHIVGAVHLSYQT